jgi:hypothetical protein
MSEIKGIYKKLITIQQKINGLGKDKDTKTDKNPSGYKYVTGSKVLENIKPLMNELQLLLKQEIISIENTRQDYATKYGTKSEILTKVLMRFTWIDCESGETDVNEFGANGQNDWEKGLGSALTYAERYFLLKYFHIATDEDDIDNPDRDKTPAVQTITASQKIECCTTLDDLGTVWNSLTEEEKKQFVALKDAKKLQLSKK